MYQPYQMRAVSWCRLIHLIKKHFFCYKATRCHTVVRDYIVPKFIYKNATGSFTNFDQVNYQLCSIKYSIFKVLTIPLKPH